MLEVASLIVVNLLIATFIGFLLGYFIGKGTSISYKPTIDNTNDDKLSEEIKPRTRSSVNPIFRKNSSVDNKPLILSTARPAGKDNLRKIKGIDLSIENNLNSLGIYHFDQISQWTNKNCDWIEEYLHLNNCIKKFQWVEQAKILELGKETVYSQKIEDKEIDIA